ncbi:putative protein kinase RLK-Pelle-LRR-IX family [Helianthus anomalus]
MTKAFLGFHLFSFIIIIILPTIIHSQSAPNDAAVMQALKTNLTPKSLDWSDPNPCNWKHIQCSRDNRVTRIQLPNQNLQGTLPQTLNTLTQLQVLELQNNQLTGPLPSLSGLSQLQYLLLGYNLFTSIPSDFFTGMSSLQHVYLDYITFSSWVLPETLKSASNLQVFSATSANINGTIPDFFGRDFFSRLTTLHLDINSLEGGIPDSFFGSSIQSLRLNGQNSRSKLNGTLDVIESMTQLTEVWLHGNMFTGTLPDFSGLNELQTFSVRDNSLIGPVPESLTELQSLKVVNLTNNMFQGPKPSFGKSVEVDISGRNSFCLPDPGVGCDDRVNKLLAVVESVGYPQVFAENWKGNDPCEPWLGIKCSAGGNITVVNLQGMGLTGCISPDFAAIKSLQRLLLADNNLSGMIPDELKDLPILIELDVSNNQLYGRVPEFKQSVTVRTEGNVDIEKDGPSTTPVSPAGGRKGSDGGGGGKPGVVVGSVVGGLVVVASLLAGVHPRHSTSDGDGVKITVAGSSTTGGPSDIHVVEAGNMVISIQVLRNVNNFSQDNILGKGGFGTVYKGELHDGTKIAVKRMESGVMSEKGLDEYCLDGNERLLVYEYMPQGTLSRFLFDSQKEDFKLLEWTKRLIIALDVARGVEYLHGLAQQSFIHRDLKPSNILLGDDMRANKLCTKHK